MSWFEGKKIKINPRPSKTEKNLKTKPSLSSTSTGQTRIPTIMGFNKDDLNQKYTVINVILLQ